MQNAAQQIADGDALWSCIADAVPRGDLEAHLALFLLNSALRSSEPSALSAPWSGALASVLSIQLPPPPLRRPQDVATLGLRLALWRESGRTDEFALDARREIAREPLPPAACLRDDERVLLGIAAGIGRVVPSLGSEILPILRDRQHQCSLRRACLDVFAEALLTGSPAMGADLAIRAYHLLATPTTARPPAEDRDRIAAFWLATRLFDAGWRPTDSQLAALTGLMDDTARACRMMLRRDHGVLDPLDAAMLLDAMTAAPATQLARASGLDRVLAVVDRFSASAAVLANRQRERTPLTVEDEYDLQDVFHALSIPVVPDIVREDPVPKIAGKSSRLDFTSKALRLGIELKYVRNGSHAKEVREELLVDEATYQVHPYIDTVIGFVHDPGGHIPLAERAAFEADLSVTIAIDARRVRYLVRVR